MRKGKAKREGEERDNCACASTGHHHQKGGKSKRWKSRSEKENSKIKTHLVEGTFGLVNDASKNHLGGTSIDQIRGEKREAVKMFREEAIPHRGKVLGEKKVVRRGLGRTRKTGRQSDSETEDPVVETRQKRPDVKKGS